MKKSLINLHFSEHGILRTMERKPLLVLLNSSAGLFTQRGVKLPAVDDNDTEIPLEGVKQVLIDLRQDEQGALELGEKLDDIILLHDNYDFCRTEIEDVIRAYSNELDAILAERETDLAQAVALCLSDSAHDKLSPTLARLAARSTKSFKEFPWSSGKEDEEAGGTEEDEEEEEFSCIRGKEAVEGILKDAEKKVNDGFSSKSYKSRCHVYAYEIPAEDEVWFIIEHGGKKLRVEDFTPESGQVKTVDYCPLTRNVVVLSYRYKMLRICANGDWRTNLYKEVFSALLVGEKGSFTDRPRYTFDPIDERNMERAFGRGEFADMIASVVVKGIETIYSFEDGPKIHKRYSSYYDLCKMWDTGRERSCETIKKIQLELKIYNPLSGRKENVSVAFSSSGTLRVGNSKYTELVRAWLRSRGFEIGFVPPEMPSCADPEANRGEIDVSVFWAQLNRGFLLGKTTPNILHGMFCKSAARLLASHLIHYNDPTMAEEWYDSNGKRWDVAKIGEGYYRYDKDTEQPTKVHGAVEERELELMKLNEKEFISDIRKALFTAHKLMDPIECGVGTSGMFNLGEDFEKRILAYVHVPGGTRDAGYSRVVARNAEDAKVKGRLVFFSFTEEPPSSNEDEVTSGALQHVFLGDMLEYDAEKNLLVIKENAWGQVAAPQFKNDENGYYSRWPLAFPPCPSFHHIDIKLNKRDFYAKFGESGRTFDYGNTSLFAQHDSKHEGESANLHLLRELILLNQSKPDGWKLERFSSSSRNALSKALRRFFGIQEQFYEETAATAHKKQKLYKLSFGMAEVDLD